MNNRFYFFAFILFGITISSCKRPGASTVVGEEPKIVCAINEIDTFSYLTSKAKLNYKDKQNDQKTNAHIRMKKDSIIWVSINAAAGIEAFRIMICPDTIHILNRLENKYIITNFDALSKQLGVQLTFGMIQALVLGNPLIPKSGDDQVIQSDTSYCVFTQVKGNIHITNHVRTPISKIEKVELTDAINILSIEYLNFVPLGNYSFASENKVGLSTKEDTENKTTSIHIEHSKTEFPEKDLNFPFNVPDRFERVNKFNGN